VWSSVRVLPARFPGAVGIVFDFPRLCRWRGEIAQSLPPRIGRCRQKCRPGLWPRQTVSGRNSAREEETGSNVGRDRFESQMLGRRPAERPRWGIHHLLGDAPRPKLILRRSGSIFNTRTRTSSPIFGELSVRAPPGRRLRCSNPVIPGAISTNRP
jgi:hypothetical protein